jgi:uncharacterized protein (AIM24 family)
MKKQTAVQLLKESIDHELKSGTKMVVNWDMYLAMEKQQILDAHWDGSIYWDNKKTEEQYYTKTYGGDK